MGTGLESWTTAGKSSIWFILSVCAGLKDSIRRKQITCRACTLSYVGETGRRLGDRFCELLRSVSKKADLPVAKHFSSPGHTTDDMMVAVVRTGLHNTRDRLRAEGRLNFK